MSAGLGDVTEPALLDLAAGRPPRPIRRPADVVPLARRHRLHGLLWSAVERGEVALPAVEARRLARLDLATRGHHRRLLHATDAVLDAAAEVALPVAVVKGLAAQARWYDRDGERPSKDIDLLVAPGHLEAAGALARRLEGSDWPPALIRLFARRLLHSLDVAGPHGIDVDVHADLLKVEVSMRRPEALWRHTETVTGIGAQPWRTLDPVATLLHFAVHLLRDGFVALKGYADLARVLERADVDWAALDDLVRGEGLQVPVYATLEVVQRTLDLPPLPVAAPAGARLELWRRLWPPQRRLLPLTYRERRRRGYWIPWLAEDRTAEAAWRLLRRRVLPPRPLVDLYYPEASGPYLWRLLEGRRRVRRAEINGRA